MRLAQCQQAYRLAQPSAYVAHLHERANARLGRLYDDIAAWPATTPWQRFSRAAGMSACHGYASGLCVTPMVAAAMPRHICAARPRLPSIPLPAGAAVSPWAALPILLVLVGTAQDMLPENTASAGQASMWPDVPFVVRAAAAVGRHGILGLPQMALAQLSARRERQGAHGLACAYLCGASLGAVLLEPLRLTFQGLYIGFSLALGIPAAAVSGVIGGCLGLLQAQHGVAAAAV